MTGENKEQEKSITTSGAIAVYLPFKTLLTAITSLSQALPQKLDKSAWPSFSNLTKGQTFNAFKFLGLVDKDGYVQPVLKDIVKESIDKPEFKTILSDILKDKYSKVIELASQNGTIAQLQETMRGYGVSGTTLERAIRFWTEAAKFSGIKYPENWKKASGGIVRRRKPSTGGDSEKPQDRQPELPKGSSSPGGYTKTVIPKGNVGTVTLTVSINPLDLAGETRDWFFKLVDVLSECPTD
jgi:hypothetical protein